MSANSIHQPSGLSERIFCLLVRFFFGAMLVFSVLLFALIFLIALGEHPHSLARAWLGYVIMADVGCVCVCAFFGYWQWRRLPKRGFILVIDSLAALLLIYGLSALMRGRL